jgi:hypothetical protein
MPFIRSLAFKHLAYCFKLIVVILLLSKIMPSYSRYKEKGLVYIIIITPSSCQPSSYSKCTVLNIYLSCNVWLMSNTECIYLVTYLYIL